MQQVFTKHEMDAKDPIFDGQESYRQCNVI